MALHIVLTGRFVAFARRAVFTAEFYRSPAVKALVDEHKKATGEDKLPHSGYPDMGSGRYAAALPYSDWLLINNAQRAHYNYIEGAPTAFILALVSGLKYPVPTAGAVVVYMLGRELYSQRYAAYGPGKRAPGAALFDIALVAMLVGAVASAGSISKLWTL